MRLFGGMNIIVLFWREVLDGISPQITYILKFGAYKRVKKKWMAMLWITLRKKVQTGDQFHYHFLKTILYFCPYVDRQ